MQPQGPAPSSPKGDHSSSNRASFPGVDSAGRKVEIIPSSNLLSRINPSQSSTEVSSLLARPEVRSSSRIPKVHASPSSLDVPGMRSKQPIDYTEEGINDSRKPTRKTSLSNRASTLRGEQEATPERPQVITPLRIPKLPSKGEERLVGVSPSRPIPSLSPNTQSLIRQLQSETSPKKPALERRISTRSEKEWETMPQDKLKTAYSDLKSYSQILVAAILSHEQFLLVKDLFIETAKTFLKDCSDVTRKSILREFEEKGRTDRIEHLAKTASLPRFNSHLSGNDELRVRTLKAIPETNDEEALKKLASVFLKNDKFISLEKILKNILSIIKEERIKEEILKNIWSVLKKDRPPLMVSELLLKLDESNFNRLTELLKGMMPMPKSIDELIEKLGNNQSQKIINYSKFVNYLIIECDSPLFVGAYKVINDFKAHYENVSVEYYQNLKLQLDKSIRKHQEAYAAKELVRELVCKTDDENTVHFICDIAYGYPWFTTMERLVSTLSISYLTVTSTPKKRQLMLRLLIEVLRVSHPKHFDGTTEDHLIRAAQSAVENADSDIRELGRKLLETREDNRRAILSGVWESPSPRLLMRMPSQTNVKNAQLQDSQKGSRTQAPYLKFEDIFTSFVKGSPIWADQMQRIAIDLRAHAFKLMKKVHLLECAGKIASPNMKLYTDYFNDVSDFVKIQILSQEDTGKRAKMIELFVTLALSLEKLNDFHTTQAIFQGVTSPSIGRLKHTWALVSPDISEQVQKLEPVYFGMGRLGKLRELVLIADKNDDPYVFPATLIQRDLSLMLEGNPKFLGNNINLELLKMLASTGYLFLSCIKRNKTIERTTTEIVKTVSEMKKLDDAALSALSEKREPTSGKHGSNIFKSIFGN